MAKGLSRRSFLKATAVGAVGIAAMSTAAAGVAEQKQEDAMSKPWIPGEAGVVDRGTLQRRAWNDKDVKLKVRWSGVNFYEFVLSDGTSIVMDPYFDDPNNTHNEYKYTPTDLPAGEWVHGADYVLLTHGHGDHVEQLPSVLEKYPAAHVIAPEHTIPTLIWQYKLNYTGHYFTPVGAQDKLRLHGFTLEACRSNHNLSKGAVGGSLDAAKYSKEDGSLDFYGLYRMIYEREIMNMKLTTDDGFSVLIWNSEMQADGYGFETRPWFYQNAKPDLFMYQVAGASFDYDRRNPNCKHMGEWIASVGACTAMPEHQQHFSYDELDSMAGKISEVCNEKGVGTAFLTPETGVWYGFIKDAQGKTTICMVDEAEEA